MAPVIGNSPTAMRIGAYGRTASSPAIHAENGRCLRWALCHLQHRALTVVLHVCYTKPASAAQAVPIVPVPPRGSTVLRCTASPLPLRLSARSRGGKYDGSAGSGPYMLWLVVADTGIEPVTSRV